MTEKVLRLNPKQDGMLAACVAEARRDVAQVRRVLARPTRAAVADSAVLLENAANRLRDLEQGLRRGGGGNHRGLALELGELRRELAQASEMLESAAALYMGWARLLFAAAAGYTARGEPAAPAAPRRLSVEG
jgi:hypothetical protein